MTSALQVRLVEFPGHWSQGEENAAHTHRSDLINPQAVLHFHTKKLHGCSCTALLWFTVCATVLCRPPDSPPYSTIETSKTDHYSPLHVDHVKQQLGQQWTALKPFSRTQCWHCSQTRERKCILHCSHDSHVASSGALCEPPVHPEVLSYQYWDYLRLFLLLEVAIG